jgi:plastocyanin
MNQLLEGSGRFIGKALAPFAFLAMASGLFSPALAGGGGTITGKVDASPAKYLEETVVYVKSAPGGNAAQKAVVDQKGMKFIPHVLAVTLGDTVEFQNHDGVDHNVFSTDNEGFNLGTFKPNETRSYTPKKANSAYSELCSVHPEMLGYLFVGQNPYHAVVGADGSFTIKDVPPGDYQVAVWNPKLKAADQGVKVDAGGSATVNFSIKR